MRIFDFIQQQQKRRFAFGFGGGQQIFDFRVSVRSRLSDNALMLHAGSKLIQLALVDMLNDDASLPGFRNDRSGQRLLGIFRDPYFI
ncbi:hypothetical protein D3C71_1527010 [compost metagenome]